MSNELNKKLLAEAFDSIVNDNDTAKATRLFKRYWDIASKNSYALLESADEDFEIDDMGDDFNSEVADEVGSDSEEKYTQAMNAVDELQNDYQGEMSDEIQGKFDAVLNALDSLKLAEEDEKADLEQEGKVALEDLKGEFEMAGEISDEMADKFKEISSAFGGESDSDDIEDISDDEDFGSDEDENSKEMVGEAEGDADELSDELSPEGEEDSSDEDLGDVSDEDHSEEPRDEEEIMSDIKYSAEDLAALIDELEGYDDGAKEDLKEAFSKISDPRKKMTSEEEGVNKKGTMNFGAKISPMKINSKAGISAAPQTKGNEPSSKVKTCSVENKGSKSWSKVAKPENKPTVGKSVLGNK